MLGKALVVTVVFISILHQTTTGFVRWQQKSVLFLISILHQTTTSVKPSITVSRLFLISILHQTTTTDYVIYDYEGCFLFQFYIKPQLFWLHHCREIVVSYFNSTSNHNSPSNRVENMRLFLISILHQTTTEQADVHISPRCFLFQFYIKPQLNGSRNITVTVVSYFNSTSNHNVGLRLLMRHSVVSYFNSTSNHNSFRPREHRKHVVSYFNSTSNHN